MVAVELWADIAATVAATAVMFGKLDDDTGAPDITGGESGPIGGESVPGSCCVFYLLW